MFGNFVKKPLLHSRNLSSPKILVTSSFHPKKISVDLKGTISKIPTIIASSIDENDADVMNVNSDEAILGIRNQVNYSQLAISHVPIFTVEKDLLMLMKSVNCPLPEILVKSIKLKSKSTKNQWLAIFDDKEKSHITKKCLSNIKIHGMRISVRECTYPLNLESMLFFDRILIFENPTNQQDLYQDIMKKVPFNFDLRRRGPYILAIFLTAEEAAMASLLLDSKNKFG